MELPRPRIGSYVRALQAALHALAPNEDFVPFREASTHLTALDPTTSGTLLEPAEVTELTGMPSFPWMERVRAEATIAAQRKPDPSDSDIERAIGLDADLGARMRDRRDLHRLLRTEPILPATRLVGAVRRFSDEGADVVLAYDRLAPDGRWVRVRFDAHTTGTGALKIDGEGRLQLSSAVQHLLTRHFATGLLALHAQLQESLAGEVTRLSRGWVGPFWYPGVKLPDGVDAALGSGLLLHASSEVLSAEIHESKHLDPLESAPEEVLPEGFHVFRERRFAASGRCLEPAKRWASDAHLVTAVRPRGRRL